MLGDYLVSVSKSIVVDQHGSATAKKATRNRFDLLLIVNDVLHTDTYHQASSAKPGVFSKECASFTTELIEQAASCIPEKDLEVEKKLKALLNYWAVNDLVSAADLKACQYRVEEGLVVARGGTPARKRNYLLPEYHGDRTAPWYELPASYMLEQMIKDPKRAIDPSRIRIARLDKKPVSTHVRKLLDNYFENIDLKYLPTGDNPTGETKKYKLWLDPLGQTVKQNKETGITETACNGYGWSVKFCQDMQKHGVPQNIKLAREDAERMDKVQDVHPTQQHRDDRHLAESPRRRRRSSSQSERQARSPRRRGSASSYDSRQSPSRSRSRNRNFSRRHGSPKTWRRESDDRGQYVEGGTTKHPRPPPRPYERETSQSGQQWNGSTGSFGNHSGGLGGGHVAPPPPQPYGQGYPHTSQPPYNALPSGPPPFPPHVPPPGQFSGQYPMPPFIPPPPPPQFQGTGGFAGVPPPPPPNFSGPYPPPPPNMTAMPHVSQGYNGHYGSPQSNSFAPNNNPPYGQNQGGFQGGRGGYGANGRGSGFNNNRGSYSGPQRGQRGSRY